MNRTSKILNVKPTTSSILPASVDVDLVRFEKNLLQIGFFGANDARDKNRATRRIEQVVIRNGTKVKVAAEFRGSESLGLPSTTDRDKFIALLKIVSEERLQTGLIANPIRFSGYRLIKELGLSRNGEIYEEILRWGKRMTDTTITSEQVVYQAAKKVYSDETLHVFRSFRRTGNSNVDGTERQEHYEVTLEDWLLENLNQRYVVLEDFNAYKQLTRPTAKGIFGNLHLWFHASQGRPVEKDYSDLCNLLNVQAYPHLSKIKSTMGLALNELVSIKYISQWDVQKMSSKLGYKIVLVPGAELMRILNNSKTERGEQPSVPLLEKIHDPKQPLKRTVDELEAEGLLIGYSILPEKAASLVVRFGASNVIEIVEHLSNSVLANKRKKVGNPAGLIIYSIEKGLKVPSSFVSSRRRKEMQEKEHQQFMDSEKRLDAEMSYDEWREIEEERLLNEQFSATELSARLTDMCAHLTRTDERYRHMVPASRTTLARLTLKKEIGKAIPSFETWKVTYSTPKRS